MSIKIINLTLPVVIPEIENLLETYLEYPYQQAFLVKVLNLHPTIKEKACHLNLTSRLASLEAPTLQ